METTVGYIGEVKSGFLNQSINCIYIPLQYLYNFSTQKFTTFILVKPFKILAKVNRVFSP